MIFPRKILFIPQGVLVIMWNNNFDRLRKRLALTYTVIFSIFLISVITVACILIWNKIEDNERKELLEQIDHEAQEYVETKEAPVSSIYIQNGTMLAYMVKPDKETIVLDQLQGNVIGDAIMRSKQSWINEFNSASMLTVYDEAGVSYRYLAGAGPVVENGQVIAVLYMFKDMEFYYTAVYETLLMLGAMMIILLITVSLLGYWLSKRNIYPISLMYEKQKQFTADASHEMRTPLAVLKLAVQGLREDTESKYSKFAAESLSMIEVETERLSKLTEALMNLARYDNSGLCLDKQSFDLGKLCQNAKNQLNLIHKERSSPIEYHGPEKLAFYGDQNAINMLLVILLDNAVKYSSQNSLITIKLENKNNKVLLSVADNGLGIKAEEKTKIFDRFYRVDKSRSRECGGLGLGLSLARTIVREHQGKILVLDNKPCGTIMKIILPK